MSWKLIDKHRNNARKITFDILIWGPSDEDSQLFELRKTLKKHLIEKGHSAKFSEDLLSEGCGKAAPDPIIDEIFHADAAHLIIVLYKSRGTQTEFDRILRYEKFSKKAVIFLEESTWNLIMKSVSKYNWKTYESIIQKISSFSRNETIERINDIIETLQFSEYIKRLELKLLNKEQHRV